MLTIEVILIVLHTRILCFTWSFTHLEITSYISIFISLIYISNYNNSSQIPLSYFYSFFMKIDTILSLTTSSRLEWIVLLLSSLLHYLTIFWLLIPFSYDLCIEKLSFSSALVISYQLPLKSLSFTEFHSISFKSII